LGLRKMWSKTWVRMSPQSQSKAREEPGFERACLALDSIKLWTYFRKSHLTHIFGEDDEMSVANIHDQSMKYLNLRQGEKEFISDFEIRFDHQVQSKKGAGVPDITDRLRAMDFIGKLDSKRNNGMLTSMRNCARQNLPGSYSKTLPAAYRTASTWTRDGLLVPMGSDSHSAFLADTAFDVTKDQKDAKGLKPAAEKNEKESSVTPPPRACFVCGKPGHIARVCPHRKSPEADFIVADRNLDEDDYDHDFLGDAEKEEAYITKEETVLLSINDVVFDNGSTIHLIKNPKLLTEIQDTESPIIANGVQSDAEGVRINQQGQFGNIGTVYYSENASANILSMSGLVDSGATVKYDQK
jgi:Zinc knuckle